MSSNDKWMPLYIGDYMGDTMHLTTLQHGAYMLLLMHYWRNGPLPDNDQKLARIARTEDKAWQSVGPVIREFFSVNGDGTLHQKRMDWELRRWGEIADKRRDAGRRGAEAKHRSHPSNGGGPATPQAKPQETPRVVQAYIPQQHEPTPSVANARILPDRLPQETAVDNLANARNLPPEKLANAKQVPDVCQDFASVPLPPQRKNLTFYLGKEAARERARGENRGETKEDLPVEASKPREPWTRDALKEILDELPPPPQPFEHPERGHTLDVQIRTVKPDRPKACHLSGATLAQMRKQAGIMVAAS